MNIEELNYRLTKDKYLENGRRQDLVVVKDTKINYHLVDLIKQRRKILDISKISILRNLVRTRKFCKTIQI